MSRSDVTYSVECKQLSRLYQISVHGRSVVYFYGDEQISQLTQVAYDGLYGAPVFRNSFNGVSRLDEFYLDKIRAFAFFVADATKIYEAVLSQLGADMNVAGDIFMPEFVYETLAE